MKLRLFTLLAALSAAGAANAQMGGGGGLSPEVHAAREAVAKACAADAKTYCDGKQGREMMMCLRDNSEKLSAPCQDAMAKMPPRQPHG
ncbi:MAG: hypothetical protein JWQ97_3674 [Phenylobacterium sp.]|nr:hypothetical protein [Phenylobacterium sp.]